MKIVAVGDIHISLRSNEAFEVRRLEALIIELNTRQEDTIVLVGDVFDRNKPSLQEIDLFYRFIHSLQFKNIWIISGNHDQTVFNYLPQTNFVYFDKPTTIENMVFVGHNYIERFINNDIFKNKSDILFTHARCTIKPFITEEIDFKVISKKYKMVVLGDIHKPCDIQKNIYYTYEPTNNHFVKYQKNTTGYLIVDTETFSIERIFPSLPYKDILSLYTIEGIEDIIQDLPKENLYKITVEIPLTDFAKLNHSHKHIVYDFIPKLDIVQQKEEKELKDLVNRKVSIEETLLQHTMDNYKFNLDTFNKVKNRIMRAK